MKKNIGSLITLALILVLLTCGVCGCFPMLGDGPQPISRSTERRWAELDKKSDEWQNFGAIINPLLGEYYLANKAKCKFPNNDNEAEIEGFPEYAASHGIHLKKGLIVDPWGDPAHLIIGHEGQNTLHAYGQIYVVDSVSTNTFVVGLLSTSPHFPVAYIWALRNGLISIH